MGKSVESEKPADIGETLVEVPQGSPKHQAFLEAIKQRELAREESGGLTPQAQADYLKAFGDLLRG